MEFRKLGRSGLKVPALSFGTGTFGGGTEFFRAWGSSDVAEATRLVDICLEAGVNLFDTADVYSAGLSEEILGKAIAGRRHDVLISTKTAFRLGKGPNDIGSSRHHLIAACEASLRRLGTDYIDIYHLHGFDALTPVEEALSTLNHLVESGKVRYIACSNFSGWHLMKSLDVSERYGWSRYVGHQVYYSLVGREYEWELMPLALDQGVGALVWSPLGWGRLTGKIRRGQPLPAVSRLHKTSENGPPVPDEYLVQSCRRVRPGGQRNRKEHSPGRAELAAAASHGFYGDHRRPQRRAVASEPGGGWMVAFAGAGSGPRSSQRTNADLSLLAPVAVRRTQPAASRPREVNK